MADTSKIQVRNTQPGIRGLNAVTGYRDLMPNEVAEVELSAAEKKNAESTGYFVFGKEAEKEPEAPEQPEAIANPTEAAPRTEPSTATGAGDLNNLSNEDLATTVAAITGKPAPTKGARESAEDYRTRLLTLARGE